MGKYNINGVEAEYDTFALGNIILFKEETNRVADIAKEVTESGVTDENAVFSIERMCCGILDFYETLFGDGTAEKCFPRMDVREIQASYTKTVQDIKTDIDLYCAKTAVQAAPTPLAQTKTKIGSEESRLNREQRRQAARDKANHAKHR